MLWTFSPIEVYGKISRASNSEAKSELAQNRIVQDYMAIVTCKFDKDPNTNWSRYPPDEIFPIISLWEHLVAMEIRVLIQSANKLYAAFTPPQWFHT